MDEREKTKFLKPVADLGAINAAATAEADLSALTSQFGYNFNTLIITNNSTEEIILILDRIEIVHIKGDGRTFAFDWEFGLIYSDLRIKNNDAAAATSANEIRISVGRTGKEQGA